MKIALIALTSVRHSVRAENYGISVLHGYLHSKYGGNVSVTVFDQQLVSLVEIYKKTSDEDFDLIGISVPIGTLSELQSLSKMIACNTSCPIILGGTLPTHVGEHLLRKFFPSGYVCFGEGELALGGLIDFLMGRIPSLDSIPNIGYLKNGLFSETKKVLVGNLGDLGTPIRSTSNKITKTGGQLYIEASRGCSWGKCTFCAIRDIGENRRIFPPESVLKNIVSTSRKSFKAQEIVFTDEEFLGASPGTLKPANTLAETLKSSNIEFNFYFATRPKSIINSSDSDQEAEYRDYTIRNLVLAGLGRVFLGVESGAKNQIRRYGKGSSAEESIKSINYLRQLGVELDVGFIMFDPLMNMDDMRENIAFIRAAEIVGSISALLHEVRIQKGTPLVRIVDSTERRIGIKICGPIDINTLNYPIIKYVDRDVEFIAKISMEIQSSYYEFWYALKGRIRSLSHLGDDGSRLMLVNYYKAIQELELQILECYVNCLGDGQHFENKLKKISDQRDVIFREILTYFEETPTVDQNGLISRGIFKYFREIEQLRIDQCI